ncbi:hypothetical protein SBA2_1240002 [Acidobacteriia bacterium SbA2]|nr:hypothetical protein SBA2_1240002 [Acidobacteriia bacterium SbA2]
MCNQQDRRNIRGRFSLIKRLHCATIFRCFVAKERHYASLTKTLSYFSPLGTAPLCVYPGIAGTGGCTYRASRPPDSGLDGRGELVWRGVPGAGNCGRGDV